LQILRQQMDAVLGQVESGALDIDSILSQDDLDEASSVLYACKLI
jgi:hypothetical protein